MLFDLRSPGRRRATQITFGGLALLFGIGYVGFGVGTGGSGGGGALNAINNGKNGSGPTYQDLVNQAAKAARTHPTNAVLWGNLARAEYTLAGQGANYNSATYTFTTKGQVVLQQVRSAWNRYLALNPSHPDPSLATIMAQALGSGGLNDNQGALRALQIVAANETPTMQTYASLAYYAYKAGDATQGDLAAKEAVKLAPASERATVQTQLNQLKTGTGSSVSTSTSTSATSSATTTGAGSNATQTSTVSSSGTTTINLPTKTTAAPAAGNHGTPPAKK